MLKHTHEKGNGEKTGKIRIEFWVDASTIVFAIEQMITFAWLDEEKRIMDKSKYRLVHKHTPVTRANVEERIRQGFQDRGYNWTYGEPDDTHLIDHAKVLARKLFPEWFEVPTVMKVINRGNKNAKSLLQDGNQEAG